MARVLVFTPTYENLLQRETVESIKALQFAGEWDWVLSDENPYPGRDMRNCTHQFEKGRRLALDGGYDAMLTVEHDMIVPPHALQRMWETPAPVVYGAYLLRHGKPTINLWEYIGPKALGQSLSLNRRKYQAAKRRGWVRVSAAGFGCLLIRAPILKKIPFRTTEHAPDLPFARDCIAQGVHCIGRFDVECGHIDPINLRTLWPSGRTTMNDLESVVALQTFNGLVSGQVLRMVRGQTYNLPAGEAAELRRGGYVQVVAVDDMETAVDPVAQGRETAVLQRTAKRRGGKRQDDRMTRGQDE